MPFQRLRRILSTPLQISIESSQGLADAVAVAAQYRPAHLNPKPPRPFGGIPNHQLYQVRAIDLLRKIGELTTPSTANLARLSASWATRRYFWAIDDPLNQVAGPFFRLSRDARGIERHQKTLLSDEFGMGFGGLIVEKLLGASHFVDMQFAIANPRQYFGVQQIGTRSPDYLFWGPQSAVYIVECKGSQTKWSAVVGQLRRGMEQLPSIQIPGYQTEEIVIATFLDESETRVLFLDPPTDRVDDEPPPEQRELPAQSIPTKVGPREWRVGNPRAFREKLTIGTYLILLRWIAQHAKARRLESTLDVEHQELDWPDAPLEAVATDRGEFVGISVPLAPEIGMAGPKIFRGLRREVLDHLEQGDLSEEFIPPSVPGGDGDPRISVGTSGTCLMIRDFEL